MKRLLLLCLLLFVTTTATAGWVVRITKISDGDTFHVRMPDNKDVKVRLLYIDTPEKFMSKKLKKDANRCGVSIKEMIYAGKLATKYAKDYFKGSKNVYIEYQGKGYYNRILGIVYKKGSDISYNEDIVKDGYSCVYKKAKYPKKFDGLLLDAKMHKRGLWGINYKLMKCLCGE